MKTAIFGTTLHTKDLINSLSRIHSIDYLITVSLKAAKNNTIAGYRNLERFAYNNGMNVITTDRYDLKDEIAQQKIRDANIDLAFVSGWQRLIPKEVLESFSTGVFGMHGSPDDLPKGRGRSPMNWAIIMDRRQFYTNLFKYQNDVDGGGILDTFRFNINDTDTIKTLQHKNEMAMNYLINKNWVLLETNKFELKSQNDEEATYYPKRTPEDGEIDWNISSTNLYNFIRAQTEPFHGTFTYNNEEKITIWDSKLFLTDYGPVIPGEVIETFDKEFLVGTRSSPLLITEYEGKKPKVGDVLSSKFYEEIYANIESRYYDFVTEEQKEITLDKMKSFYK